MTCVEISLLVPLPFIIVIDVWFPLLMKGPSALNPETLELQNYPLHYL